MFPALGQGQPGLRCLDSRTHLERWAIEGDSPVGEIQAGGDLGQSTIPWFGGGKMGDTCLQG